MMRNEKPGGHGERSVAVGVLDMALWDAVPRPRRCRSGASSPTATTAARPTRPRGSTPPADIITRQGFGQLQDEMRGYLDRGYPTVKMKIGGGDLATDLRRIEAVLKVVGKGEALAVDVNGRFDLDTAIEYAEALAPYGLRWYEEPVDPLDYLLHATLATRYAGALATGENLFSMQDARNLIRYGGFVPIATSSNSIRHFHMGSSNISASSRCCKANGWSPRRCVPHGGHQFALNIAVGLGLGGEQILSGRVRTLRRLCRRLPVVGGRVRPPGIPASGSRPSVTSMA